METEAVNAVLNLGPIAKAIAIGLGALGPGLGIGFIHLTMENAPDQR